MSNTRGVRQPPLCREAFANRDCASPQARSLHGAIARALPCVTALVKAGEVWQAKVNRAMFVSVAFAVTTMFLGVSHAGERPDYVPPCPEEFVKAWDAWDQTDPAKMPPLPKQPCLLVSWNHAYICSQEEGGCGLDHSPEEVKTLE
jgi:hypothetical protein